ncbi:pyridoxamine 5'-phosphate oxidase family protein [Natronomonas sp. F2-12]|jgi:nitroimidazol reductase NimA-like FMN-containing flavoprotein (pyridoxamine 5'-phosphate oxidase superfamily)|uniref:Pyridoxamine 5'-phosphate oxidase family protein n=1 Tax=Natronomonas aquatica TaxID=2841590 RepID=A0A9R1CQA8_9EURY|nr:pyridoxamine 5'-phosphate oxidase family protein [Natronomonas aquatica]MCQ4332000.1 pyridoxamine 5'-phosphate oxidase family protein [Natronomonas aquatica]
MVDSSPEEIQLDESERDAFLDRVDTGVLSLSTPGGEAPHSVPVSFGYNAARTVFYFRIADLPPERKGELDGRAVTFVTYGTDEAIGGYVSVVAQGSLERTTDEETATEALKGLEGVTIPFVDIFGERPADIDFSFYRLVPEGLTGRKEATTGL